MPPARHEKRSGNSSRLESSFGRQRGLSINMVPREERAPITTIWNSIISFQVGNDGLKDLLVQDRPPLPLLPDVMGIMEKMSQSKCSVDESLDGASQLETVRRLSSETGKQSHSDSLDIPVVHSEPWLQEEPRAAEQSPTLSSAQQEASQSSGSSSTSDPDYQDLLDPFELPDDDRMDTSRVDSTQMDVENWGDLDEFMAEIVQDTDNAPAVETASTDTCCWDHGCNGKKFSTRSNLIRHQLEKGKARHSYRCPLCDAYFSRTTARNQHVENKSCSRVRRYSNGRERPRPRVQG